MHAWDVIEDHRVWEIQSREEEDLERMLKEEYDSWKPSASKDALEDPPLTSGAKRSPVKGCIQTKCRGDESGINKENSDRLANQNYKDLDSIDKGKVQPENDVKGDKAVIQSEQQVSRSDILDSQPEPLESGSAIENLADAALDNSSANSLFGDGVDDELQASLNDLEEWFATDNNSAADNDSAPGTNVFIEQTKLQESERSSKDEKVHHREVQVIDLTEEGLQTPAPAAPAKKDQNTDISSVDDDHSGPSLQSTCPEQRPLLRKSSLHLPEPPTLDQQIQQIQKSYQQVSRHPIIPPRSSPSNIHLTPAPKRGPKAKTAPVQSADMSQRCRQRLNNSLRHVRAYLQGLGKTGRPISHPENKQSMLNAVKRVISDPALAQHWRGHLEVVIDRTEKARTDCSTFCWDWTGNCG
jgi:hypothetical protein